MLFRVLSLPCPYMFHYHSYYRIFGCYWSNEERGNYTSIFIRYWLLYCINSRAELRGVCVIKALRLPFYFKLIKAALECKEIFKSSR